MDIQWIRCLLIHWMDRQAKPSQSENTDLQGGNISLYL